MCSVDETIDELDEAEASQTTSDEDVEPKDIKPCQSTARSRSTTAQSRSTRQIRSRTRESNTSSSDEEQTVNISRSKKLCVENKDKANRNSLSRSFSQKLELQQNNDIKKPINEKSNSELTMWDMLELVKVNKFPKKEIKIGDSITSYTAILHFFKIDNEFKTIPKDQLSLECQGCHHTLYPFFGKFTSLNKHMRRCKNDQFKKWYRAYKCYQGNGKHTEITKDMLELVKLIISTNVGFSILDNPSFLYFVEARMPIPPGKFQVQNTILPVIFERLINAIGLKLKNSIAACLIVDIWSSPRNLDFIAIAFATTDSYFQREFYVADMIRMKSPHSAENVKAAVEEMVNKFGFNKKKLNGKKQHYKITFWPVEIINLLNFKAVICDQGSNLVRLFGEINDPQNSLLSKKFYFKRNQIL